LVRQKLEEAQIKKLRISADTFEIDQYIEKLAMQNGLSQYEFLDMIKSKNIDIEDYKKDLSKKIKTEKLYASVYRENLQALETSEVEKFYKDNPQEFKVANAFDVSIYTSNEPKDLQAILQNPMLQPPSVTIEKQTLSASTLNNQLKTLLNSTKEGEFTQIANIQNIPTMFYLKEKKDVQILPFEEVKQAIFSVLAKQKEQQVLKDYFEKLKSSAAIKVVRNPS
jgi:hypothetical protein